MDPVAQAFIDELEKIARSHEQLVRVFFKSKAKGDAFSSDGPFRG